MQKNIITKFCNYIVSDFDKAITIYIEQIFNTELQENALVIIDSYFNDNYNTLKNDTNKLTSLASVFYSESKYLGDYNKVTYLISQNIKKQTMPC